MGRVSVPLNTCVISELYRAHADQRVRNAVERRQIDEPFLSVVTFGEARKRAAYLASGRERSILERWLEEPLREYAEPALPIGVETSHIWGEIATRARLAGEQIAVADGLIAATAIRHGFRILTRNTRHFQASGVRVVGPWQDYEESA